MTSLLFSVLLACAHKVGPIKGQIVNGQGNPIKGAQVKLEGFNAIEYTNETGQFKISAPLEKKDSQSDAEQSVLISMLGYEPIRLKLIIQNRTHHIKKPIVLESLEIRVPYRQKNLDVEQFETKN